MKKGVGVGIRAKLSKNYIPEQKDLRRDLYCGNKQAPLGKYKGDPLECFKKGFGIGKKLQYGKQQYIDSFDEEHVEQQNTRTLILAFLVMLIVFGLLFMVDIYWAWSLLVGFIAGTMFWYFCAI